MTETCFWKMFFKWSKAGKKPWWVKYDDCEVYEVFYGWLLAFNILAVFVALDFIIIPN